MLHVQVDRLLLIVLTALVLSGPQVSRAEAPADSNDPNSATAIPLLTPVDANAVGQANGSLGGSALFLHMMGAILVVAGMGVVAIYLSKKVLPKVSRGSAKEIRVVETVYLGPRKALHLVQVGHHRLLIGSTNESISPLASVSEDWLDISKPLANDVTNP
jgi:flagellar biosynthetic protein FliO